MAAETYPGDSFLEWIAAAKEARDPQIEAREQAVQELVQHALTIREEGKLSGRELSACLHQAAEQLVKFS